MSNVNAGDMARVVAPYVLPGRGSIVTVVRAANPIEKLGDREYEISGHFGVGWVVSGWVRDEDDEVCGPQVVIGDDCLRKINPGKGEDEMISIARRNGDAIVGVKSEGAAA